MGRLTPVLAACILNSCGFYIFRTPANLECFPLTAYLMFLTSIFYLLWNIPLNPYPSCFRDLAVPANFTLEFLIDTLMIELVITDFWCPLQTKFMAFIPTIPDLVNEALSCVGIDGTTIADYLEFFKSEESQTVLSHVPAIFFIICIMHTTRVIDLRLVRCGVDVFVLDISRRIQHFVKSLIQYDDCKIRIPGGVRPSRRCHSRRRVSSSYSEWTAETDSIGSESISEYLSSYW